MPCSTRVTSMALNTADCCGPGSDPLISSHAISPRLTLPRISLGKSRPHTTMRSDVLHPMLERIGFLVLIVTSLKIGTAQTRCSKSVRPVGPALKRQRHGAFLHLRVRELQEKSHSLGQAHQTVLRAAM